MKLPHLTCLRCGHTWIPRNEKRPSKCPKCTSPYWDKPRRNIKGIAKLVLLALLYAGTPSLAMGRLPTDPATWGDVENSEAQTSVVNNREIADNANTNARIDAQNSKIDNMNETKVMVEGVLRIYDAKRFTLEAFNSYDAAHSQEFAAGVRITLKLGKSYEERLLEQHKSQIDQLEQMIKVLQVSK